MKRPPPSPNRCRIVLTGGPGGGKTTAADLFRREIGDRVVIVPEAATILFQGGFPRSREPQASRFAQTAIFHVQRHLEDVQAALFPGRTLLCDRGTVDGAVYWPGQPHDYWRDGEWDRLRLAARFSTDEALRADAYRRTTAIFLEHSPWIVVLQPFEDYGLRRYVDFTPNPDQQLELRRFNFRLRRA